MSRAVSLATLALIAALAPLSAVQAQVATPPAGQPTPSARDLLRDLPAAPAMPALTEPGAPAATGPTDKAPAVSFVLRELHVRGASELSPQAIADIAQPFVGKPMGEAELGALIARLRQRFDSLGLGLAAVGFPTQDVSKGELTIDVVEPRLGRVQVPMGADAPISQRRVEGLLSFFNLRNGGSLNTLALERVMFALNDMPGVLAKAALTPAGDEGVYNLSILTQPRRAWDASVGVDNQGVGDAGRWRTTGMVRLNNPLGMGDNLDVQGMLSNSSGVKVGRVAYELPVGYTPARLAVAYARVAYKLAGDFADFEANGMAGIFEANLSYPLMRSRTRTLMARVGVESKALTDKLDAVDYRTDKRVLGGVAGLSYESRDAWLGGGFNAAAAQWHLGHLKLVQDDQQQKDAALGDYGTVGQFNKLGLQLSRLQMLSRTVSLFASASMQAASRKLDSAEKISLGGPHGVRAYPTSEGASDDATLINTELRYWVDRNWTVFGLYDWAHGRRDHNVTDADAANNGITLHGTGLGVAASYPQWVSLKATVAWRGSRPAETDTGKDKPRLYLQAQHTF